MTGPSSLVIVPSPALFERLCLAILAPLRLLFGEFLASFCGAIRLLFGALKSLFGNRSSGAFWDVLGKHQRHRSSRLPLLRMSSNG